MKKRLLEYVMHTPPWSTVFWKLWLWYGIRQATKERKIREAEAAKRPIITNDEYWEKVHNDRNNNV